MSLLFDKNMLLGRDSDDGDNHVVWVWSDGTRLIPDEIRASLEMGLDGIYLQIKVPERITTVAPRAFFADKHLQEMHIPALRAIGEAAFSHCAALRSFTIDQTPANPRRGLLRGFTKPHGGMIAKSAFEDCVSLTTLDLPDTVTLLGSRAFCHCRALRTVTLPSSLRMIGSDCFAQCVSLTAVTLPDTLERIETGAFLGCRALASVSLPDSLQTIGPRAFLGCHALSLVTLPAQVQSIGEKAFDTSLALCYETEAGTLYIPPRNQPEDDLPNLPSVFRAKSLENAMMAFRRLHTPECRAAAAVFILHKWRDAPDAESLRRAAAETAHCYIEANRPEMALLLTELGCFTEPVLEDAIRIATAQDLYEIYMLLVRHKEERFGFKETPQFRL